MMLNELAPGMEAVIAPTDCRLRPDLRAMENGDIGKCRVHICLILYLFILLIIKSLPGKFHSCFYYSHVSETASQEKERLEEKQRAARRERSKDEEDWSTR